MIVLPNHFKDYVVYDKRKSENLNDKKEGSKRLVYTGLSG
jgi:hypothetical protein